MVFSSPDFFVPFFTRGTFIVSNAFFFFYAISILCQLQALRVYLYNLLRQPSDPSYLLGWPTRYVLLILSWSFNHRHFSFVVRLSSSPRRRHAVTIPFRRCSAIVIIPGLSSHRLHHSIDVIPSSSLRRHHAVVVMIMADLG